MQSSSFWAAWMASVAILSVPVMASTLIDSPAAVDCAAGQFCGRVVDAKGSPMDLVELRVEPGDFVTLSEDGGRFSLPADLLSTAAAVVFSAPGFATVRVELRELLKGARDVILPRVEQLETIVVAARTLSTPFAPRVVDKMTLLTDPSANADVLVAVASLPTATGVDGSADPQLRGGAIGLTRVYFNDIPLYEATRGSPVDMTTRAGSIFNPGIVKDVEVYPTNPPAYLANSAAGAIRVLPDDQGTDMSSLYAGLTGLSLSTSRGLDGGGAMQAYLSASDLSGFLTLNPDLQRDLTSFRSGAGGVSLSLPFGERSEATILGILDAEDGRYPLSILEFSGPSRSERFRSYTAVSLETPFDPFRVKIDLAYTATSNRLTFRDFDALAHNAYGYAAVDMAGQVARVDFRAGVAGEFLDLRTTGSLSFYDATGLSPPTGRLDRRAQYGSAYFFGSFALSRRTSVAVGLRAFAADDPSQDPVASLAATWRSSDRRHKLIFGIGSYSALSPPDLGSAAAVAAARSRQVALDYAFDVGGWGFEAGVYAKRDRFAGESTDIRGADMTLRADLGERSGLEVIAATSRQRVAGVVADGDLPYLAAVTLRWSFWPRMDVHLRYTARSGAAYTRVVGAGEIHGISFPIFEQPENQGRLPSSRVLDLAFYFPLSSVRGSTRPIARFTINNLLDREVPSAVVYSGGYQDSRLSFRSGRSINFGLAFSL